MVLTSKRLFAVAWGAWVVAWAALMGNIYLSTLPRQHGVPLQWAAGVNAVLLTVGGVVAIAMAVEARERERLAQKDHADRMRRGELSAASLIELMPSIETYRVEDALIMLPTDVIAAVRCKQASLKRYEYASPVAQALSAYVTREIDRVVEKEYPTP